VASVTAAGRERSATPIVALDVSSAAAALALVERLGDSCRFYKIGSELFTREGPAVVQAVRGAGCDVFLDLKFHDIPNTVRESARAAASLGVRLLTVHASGGGEMVRAAVEGAGASCGVLAVTVLTSLDAATLGGAWGRDTVTVEHEVLRLARLAAGAGAHGIVCSGHEAGPAHAAFPELALLVPGIRLAGGASHDQARVSTPASAARAGARYLVLGRAVTGAPDPLLAMRAVHDELAQAR
jgi:orotidine-5'-phosphate decarboxylase